MSDSTIDLRNLKRPEVSSAPVPEIALEAVSAPVLDDEIQEVQPSSGKEELPEVIEWETYEYEKHVRGPYWFLLPGSVATALIIFGILSKNYFFIAFSVLAVLVFFMYEKKGPQKILMVLSREGVRAGRMNFKYAELKSFWIFSRTDGHELSLSTNRALMPFLRVPLGNEDAEAVREFLLKHMAEEEHTEFATDQLMRSLGL